jgi:hypothetical protein
MQQHLVYVGHGQGPSVVPNCFSSHPCKVACGVPAGKQKI